MYKHAKTKAWAKKYPNGKRGVNREAKSSKPVPEPDFQGKYQSYGAANAEYKRLQAWRKETAEIEKERKKKFVPKVIIRKKKDRNR